MILWIKLGAQFLTTKMPTTVNKRSPINNNKDEKIEVSDEELYLFQVVDEVLYLAVHSSGSIDIVFKTNIKVTE